MTDWPDNPNVRAISSRDDIADIWETARAVGVKPGTIRVWMTRKKVAPILRRPGHPDLFHVPTIAIVAQAGQQAVPAQRAPKHHGRAAA